MYDYRAVESPYSDDDDIVTESYADTIFDAPWPLHGVRVPLYGIYAGQITVNGKPQTVYSICAHDPEQVDELTSLSIWDVFEIIADNYPESADIWEKVYRVISRTADERIADDVIREAVRSGDYSIG